VRSGEFVDCLIRDAANPDEYAFALGASRTTRSTTPAIRSP
jgi:hypothetical protein